jgi:6-phosphogluconolactonase
VTGAESAAEVEIHLEIVDDPDQAARRAAAAIAAAARDAVEDRGTFALALSGGRASRAMCSALADEDVPWDLTGIWQADERIAAKGHRDRNLTLLEEALPATALAHMHPMPVDGLEVAADETIAAHATMYAAGLPEGFDLVHLGLGEDGHTASLVPGDPVLDEQEREVAITRPYAGRRRMTLTEPVLARARILLWLVTGPEKAGPLRRLLARDPSIPAGRIRASDQRAIADRAAVGDIDPARRRSPSSRPPDPLAVDG